MVHPCHSGPFAVPAFRLRASLRLALAVLVGLTLVVAGDGVAATTPPPSPHPYEVTVVQTAARGGQRMSALPGVTFGTAKRRPGPSIRVNATDRYQTISGFGAAMTDSSAWLIQDKLSAANRQTLMNDFFTTAGIHLNFVKVPMGGSDFTRNGRPYTYDDVAPKSVDPSLAHFSIAHDEAYILPALREALALNPATEFEATPWSPPAWMKSNQSLSNVDDLGSLLPADYRAWADYFVKFIQAYAAAGVPISAITPQNEPDNPTLYPGLDFPPATEASWLVHDLEPALAQAKLHPKLYGVDLGWGPTTAYQASSIKTSAARTLTGLAWHCYYGPPSVMSQFHQEDPRLDEIVDECSPGISPTPIAEVVISSLRDWASSVALWNLALDPTGGPAELPNHGCMGCSGLATIDPTSGALSLNQAYYQLGQASAFIQPGAQRIASNTFVSYGYAKSGANVVSPGVDDVAVRNPDGSIVLIAYNNGTTASTFSVAWRARAFTYRLPAGSMVTFEWNRP